MMMQRDLFSQVECKLVLHTTIQTVADNDQLRMMWCSAEANAIGCSANL